MRTNIIVSILLMYSTLYAQQQEKDWTSELSGYLEQDHITYFQSLENTSIGNHQDETSIGLTTFLKYKNKLRFQGGLRTILNYQNRSRTQFLLNEAFVQWRSAKFEVKAGKQVLDWGELTGYSPADRQNRITYFDFLDVEREDLGIWAIATRWSIGKTNLELTLVPYFQPSQFYVGESRWLSLPETSVIPENPTQPVSTQFDISTGNTSGADYQAAIAWDFITGRVDWKLRYFYGLNAIPHSSVENTGFSPETGLQFAVNLEHERLHMASTTFSTYAGSFNLWGELNASQTRRLNLEGDWVEDPYYQFIVGTDRMWLFPNLPESNLLLLVEYVHLFNFHQNEYSNLDLDLIFQNAILNKIEFQLNYDWEIALTNAVEFRFGGYYHQLKVGYKPFPSLELQLATDVLYGESDSFFGHYRRNKRLQLKVAYLFAHEGD